MKKYLALLLPLFFLWGCEDEPKKVENVQQPQPVEEVVTVVPSPDFDDDKYTLLDVEQNYTQCLIVYGLDEDDFCEERCASMFDYDSCDLIEDKYERLYGIGSDEVSPIFVDTYSKRTIVTEGSWIPYGGSNCSYKPLASTIEKGKSFSQTKTCKQKRYRFNKYNDGTTYKEYGTNVSTTYSTAMGTKVIVDKNVSTKYSSNLLKTKTVSSENTDSKTNNNVESKSISVEKTNPTDSTAKQYSSNLLNTKKVEAAKVEKSVKNVDKTKSSDNTNTSKQYSSNLLSSKAASKTVEEDKSITTEVAVVTGAATAAYSSNLLKSKATTKETETKTPVTVVKSSSWKDSGSAYGCSSWSPSASSKTKGTSFKQTAKCKQKQVKTLTMSDGTTKTETQVKTVSKTKTAYGTKKSSSSSYSKKKKY